MTKEEKELLIQDLCARLPYEPIVYWKNCNYGDKNKYVVSIDIFGMVNDEFSIEECKPYLRPLSSMTEDEKVELLHTIVGKDGIKYFQVLSDGSIDNTDAAIQDLNKFNMHWVNFDKDTVTSYFDWLNQHHFDYRELIKKDLAISTEEFNPYK